MGIVGKLEVEIDIKSSGDLFHELLAGKPHHVSGIIPHRVQDCILHDGEYGDHGSVLVWHYTHQDGKKNMAKCLMEVDEEKQITTFNVMEGDLLEDFSKFKAYVQVIRKGEVTTVKWTAEFEKIKDDGPYPTDLMDHLIASTKDIETHHVTA